jgi:hypothetical protein
MSVERIPILLCLRFIPLRAIGSAALKECLANLRENEDAQKPALSPANVIFAGSLRTNTNIQYELRNLDDAFSHLTIQIRQVPSQQIGWDC